MSDPFLQAHEVRPACYDIGGVQPFSIRDQMIRGRMLIDRALQSGIIGSGRKLLVYGAGVGGSTAAIYAAQRGVETLLVDPESPFSRQAGCLTRWVDPVQYDWPAPHWNRGIFPHRQPPMPLPWIATYANQLAAGWLGELRKYTNPLPGQPAIPLSLEFPVELDPDVQYVSAAHHSHLIAKLYHRAQNHWFNYFPAMLLTVGVGNERSYVTHASGGYNNYVGFDFWDTEDLALDDLGFGKSSALRAIRPRVLISGGGDGSLQDMLRVLTTTRSARDFYENITSALTPDALEVWEQAMQSLHQAEDLARRAYIWGAKEEHDHPILSELHTRYGAVVKWLWQQVGGELLISVARQLKWPLPDVTMVHPCEHFTRCYGLNRLLVLLLEASLVEMYVPSPIRPDTRVSDVRAASYAVCAPNGYCDDPGLCYGQDHEVYFADSTCGAAGAEYTQPEIYNVVIIRHGVDAGLRLRNSRPHSRPRHVLPFHAI